MNNLTIIFKIIRVEKDKSCKQQWRIQSKFWDKLRKKFSLIFLLQKVCENIILLIGTTFQNWEGFI